ncbi:hypothetical protein D3C85_1816390 [compost metagenome]
MLRRKPVTRIQYRHAGGRAVSKGGKRRKAGITVSCTDHPRFLTDILQKVLDQARVQLRGEILGRMGRAMK